MTVVLEESIEVANAIHKLQNSDTVVTELREKRKIPKQSEEKPPVSDPHGPDEEPEIPVIYNPAWEGKTLDGRGAGTTGGRGREILASEEEAKLEAKDDSKDTIK